MKIKKTEYKKIKSYITKDGSIVRELMHPDIFPDIKQSLAEANVPVGGETLLHRHIRSDEIYHIIQGHGMMVLGDVKINVAPGIPSISLPIPHTKSRIQVIHLSQYCVSAALRIRMRIQT